MRTRDLRSAVFLAGGIGLIISLFAAAETFDASLQKVCSVGGFISCAAVAHSGLTTTLGLPDWSIGVGGFIALLVAAAFADRNRSLLWYRSLLVLSTIGLVASLYFLYVEVVEIHALCPVCASAYVANVGVWVPAFLLVRHPVDPDENDPDGDPGARDDRPE